MLPNLYLTHVCIDYLALLVRYYLPFLLEKIKEKINEMNI